MVFNKYIMSTLIENEVTPPSIVRLILTQIKKY